MKIVLGLLFILSFQSSAAEVAFIEIYDFHGRPVELEPGSRFAHVLIRYKDKWLHSHPGLPGVALSDDPAQFGRVLSLLVDPSVPEPSDEFVRQWLEKPFDFTFSWTNKNATYCTRLVAQFLSVSPQPMHFAGNVWKKFPGPRPGGVGLSPDELHQELLTRGFREARTCADFLDSEI